MGRQSAARLEGDRYQHLFSWWMILQMLEAESKIEHVWLEHSEASFVDDVTVHPQDPSKNPTKYYQVKWHVDHRTGYSMDSLAKRKRGSISLLEKMWDSWNRLKGLGPLEIWLVSNGGIAAGDPLGYLIQGRDNRLKDEFLTSRARSRLNICRQKWQTQLKANDQEFTEFYHSLRFQLSFASLERLNELVDDRTQSLGLVSGENARRIAIEQVRVWIEERGNNQITLEKLRGALTQNQLWLPKTDNGIVISVQNWSKRQFDVKSDYDLDWSRFFEHSTRRVPKANVWTRTLLPQLRALEQKIKTKNSTRLIRLRGDMALSTAFAVGHTFSAAAGYRFEIQHRQQVWFSDVLPDEAYQIDAAFEDGIPNARDLLCIISVTGDAKPQVLRYTAKQKPKFRARLFIEPIDGPHDHSIRGNVDASSFARQVRIAIRQTLDKFAPRTIHLFYFGPASLAVLIGQKLNACGEIQFYEFQNPDYVPSCRLK